MWVSCIWGAQDDGGIPPQPTTPAVSTWKRRVRWVEADNGGGPEIATGTNSSWRIFWVDGKCKAYFTEATYRPKRLYQSSALASCNHFDTEHNDDSECLCQRSSEQYMKRVSSRLQVCYSLPVHVGEYLGYLSVLFKAEVPLATCPELQVVDAYYGG
jgi:hypothetical protein